MSPNGKKVELFGRPHNCRENWVTLGNQLPGVYLEDDDICKRFKNSYIYKIRRSLPTGWYLERGNAIELVINVQRGEHKCNL